VSEATWAGLSAHPEATARPPELVKGRATPVTTYLLERDVWSAA
jgi:hypothetical protein